MANNEIKTLKTNTFEEWRLNTNIVSQDLGAIDELSSNITSSVYTLSNTSGSSINRVLVTPSTTTSVLPALKDSRIDNIAGWIVLRDTSDFESSTSLASIASGDTITQSDGSVTTYTAEVVSVSTLHNKPKILVTNSTGSFNVGYDILESGATVIESQDVLRLISESYHRARVRVSNGSTVITEGLGADQFHFPTIVGGITLATGLDLTYYTEGTIIYQTADPADSFTTLQDIESTATWYATVYHADTSSDVLYLKGYTGTYDSARDIKIINHLADTIDSNNHTTLINYRDSDNAFAIRFNSAQTHLNNTDITLSYTDTVDALNELQSDIGVTENLTTAANDLTSAVNEHEDDLYTSTTGSFDGLTSKHFKGAVEELRDELGNHASLTTNTTTDAVSAINELEGVINTDNTARTNYDLNTNTHNIVSAVNEFEGFLRSDTSARTNYTLSTASFNVEGAINELDAQIGAAADGTITFGQSGPADGTNATTIMQAVNSIDQAVGDTYTSGTEYAIAAGSTIAEKIGNLYEDIHTANGETLNTDANFLVGGINELETALRGSGATYTGFTDNSFISSTNIRDAVNEIGVSLGSGAVTGSVPISTASTAEWLNYSTAFDLDSDGVSKGANVVEVLAESLSLANVVATIDSVTGNITLEPNTSLYDTGNSTLYQDGNDGNAFVESDVYLENTSYVGGIVNLAGDVTTNDIHTRYEVSAFIKVVDRNAGYNLVGTISSVTLNTGTFTVTKTIPENNPGTDYMVQLGLSIKGKNANASGSLTLGSVEIEDFVATVSTAEFAQTEAAGATNLTNAVTLLNSALGDSDSYNDGFYGSSTVAGTLDKLQAGVIGNDDNINDLAQLIDGDRPGTINLTGVDTANLDGTFTTVGNTLYQENNSVITFQGRVESVPSGTKIILNSIIGTFTPTLPLKSGNLEIDTNKLVGMDLVDTATVFTGLTANNIKGAVQEIADTTLAAGSGLTGGGNLQANRTFDVGAGDGITVNADDIQVDTTVLRTSTTDGQTVTQDINFGQGNLTLGDAGKTLLIRPFNTLDVQGNLQIGGATGSTLTYKTSFFEVAGETTTQGISIDRTSMNVGNIPAFNAANERDDGTFAPIIDENILPKIQWNEGRVVDGSSAYDPHRAWQTVAIKRNDNDDGWDPVTSDIVTYYNAKDLIEGNTEVGVNATWDANGQHFNFSLTDSGVTAATYGSQTELPALTVDRYGRVTSATTVPITTTLELEDDDGSVQYINLTSDTLKISGKANQLKADTNTELHTDGNFVVGQVYRVVNADVSTDWNYVAGTSGTAYVAGMEFTAAEVGSASLGSGTADTVTDTITLGFIDDGNAVQIPLVDITNINQSTGTGTGALTVQGGASVAKNLHVGGDLVVHGTNTVLNTETLTVDDNIIVLHDDKTGAVVANETSGIEVERGDSSNVRLRWNEGIRPAAIDDPSNPGQQLPAIPGSWQVTVDGTNYHNIITEDTDYDFWTLKATSQSGGDNSGVNVLTDNVVDFKTSTTDSVTGLTIDRTGKTITYSHADTSSISGSFGSYTASTLNAGSAITSIEVDGLGHTTSITSVDFDDRYLQTFGVQDGDGDNLDIGAHPWQFAEDNTNGTANSDDGATVSIDWTQTSADDAAVPYKLSFAVSNTDKGSSQKFFRTINVFDAHAATAVDETVQAEINEDTVRFETANAGLALTGTTGAGATGDTVTFANTDRGSSQPIFKSILTNNVQQAPGTNAVILASKNSKVFQIVSPGNTKWSNIVLGDAQSVSDNLTTSEQTTLASSGLTLHTPGSAASRSSYGSAGDVFTVGAALAQASVSGTTGTVRFADPESNGLVYDGSFVVGSKYRIAILGQTVWNTIAGTTDVNYEVGDIIDAVNVGTIRAHYNTGIGQLLSNNHQTISSEVNNDSFGFIGNNNGVVVSTSGNDDNNFIDISHANTSDVTDRGTVLKEFISGLTFDQFGHTVGFQTQAESDGTLTLNGGTALQIATANNANKFDADASSDKTITINHDVIPTTFSNNADATRDSISLSLDRNSFVQNTAASQTPGESDANDLRSDNHGLLVGDKVSFTINSGQLNGGGLISGDQYYVRWVSADGNYFQLASTNRGTRISITDNSGTQTSNVTATIAMVKPVASPTSTISTNSTSGAPGTLMAVTGLDRDSQGHINKALTTEFTLPNYSWTINDDGSNSHVVRPGSSSLTINTTEPATSTGCSMSATLTGSTLNLVATNTDKGSSQNIFKKVTLGLSSDYTNNWNGPTASAELKTITAQNNNDTIVLAQGFGINLDVSGATDDVIRIENSAPNQATNLSVSTTTSNVTVASSDGTDAVLAAASAAAAGVMTSVSHNKLAGLGDNEQATSNTGTITGVSSGTGLSGGATSGAPTLSLNTDQRFTSGNSVYAGNTHEYILFAKSGYMRFQVHNAYAAKLTSLGHLIVADNITAYGHNQLSDRNLKENIEKVDGALELVSQLEGVTFNWKKNGKEAAGVIAQEVEKVLPSAVSDVETLDETEHKVVDYNQLSALFIESIKELKEENKRLRADIEQLKLINNK